MKVFGQLLIIMGFFALFVALFLSESGTKDDYADNFFLLLKVPWTNVLFMFCFPGLLGLSYLLNKHFVYRFGQKLIGSIQIIIGLSANITLIGMFIDTFIYDVVNGTPPIRIEFWIIIVVSLLWWPLAYFYFSSLLKKRPPKALIMRAIWTTGGMFWLLEIFRGLESHIIDLPYWLENQTYSVLTVSGFALIFLGGIITEVAMLRTAKHT